MSIDPMSGNLYEKIKQVVDPIIADSAMELVELNVRQKKGDVFIQVLADRKGGGISLDDCTRLNRKFAAILDDEDFLKDRYVLDVSSPGIDRLLRTSQDFSRITGKKVRIYLSEPVAGCLEHAGVVKEVGDNDLAIETPGGAIVIPIGTINKAQQVI